MAANIYKRKMKRMNTLASAGVKEQEESKMGDKTVLIVMTILLWKEVDKRS